MPCNAWNHGSNCNCGWGGAYYESNRNTSNLLSTAGERFAQVKAFVNPNAACPVCGAKVFYYCNSNGSSVFFDDLGWPWPKHACTDSRQPPKLSRQSTRSRLVMTNNNKCHLFSIVELNRLGIKSLQIVFQNMKDGNTSISNIDFTSYDIRNEVEAELEETELVVVDDVLFKKNRLWLEYVCVEKNCISMLDTTTGIRYYNQNY